MALYIGLMSGTSMDGVDAVLAEIVEAGESSIRTLAHVHRAMPVRLREELLELNASGPDELHRAALAANALTRLYAQALEALLDRAGVGASGVRAIGAHGQTVRHRPRAFDGTGYTLQLINGALLAELGGIDVVCDFRSRDVAAGGQGAPLVPAFHAALFGSLREETLVLNVGGIANLSILRPDGRVQGFDCGPGNALMDLWCQRHRGEAFDRDGGFAASGQVDDALLADLLAEPFVALAPPKSTGRDLFNAAWLDSRLAAYPRLSPADVMATLTEFTARCTTVAARQHGGAATQLLVCGGGAFNRHLMQRLASLLPGVTVASTAARGVAPDQIEAMAFAWLARAFVARRPSNLPAVTGAAGPRLLGALYPA